MAHIGLIFPSLITFPLLRGRVLSLTWRHLVSHPIITTSISPNLKLEGSQICPILECLPTSQSINAGESNDIMISESFRVPEKVSPDRDHQNCLNWGLPSHMIA
jgi:hypothetical protein